MFKTGTEQYKAHRQVEYFKKNKAKILEDTDLFENFASPLQRRLLSLVDLESDEEPIIASLYLNNWLLMSSRRLYFVSELCEFCRIHYHDIAGCGWWLPNEEYSPTDSDGIKHMASPKLRVMHSNGEIFVALLKPGNEHNIIYNTLLLRLRLDEKKTS